MWPCKMSKNLGHDAAVLSIKLASQLKENLEGQH